jgi:adenosylcobinamide-GDP ribazoletransferase
MFRSLLTAISHLSVIPLGAGARRVAEGREGEILVFFPFAGLLVGIVPALVLQLTSMVTVPGSPLPAALTVAAFALVTGAANLVNLAATADSAASGRAGSEALNNDPLERIAAPGAAAVGLVLLVKFAALVSLAGGNVPATAALPGGKAASMAGALTAILLAATLSRWAAVVLAAYSEYARPEGGDDEWMVRYCGARELRWSLVPAGAVVAFAALGGWASIEALSWVQVILATIGCLLTAYVASLYFERRFGGVIGRQLGAVIELAETVALVICAMPAARLVL